MKRTASIALAIASLVGGLSINTPNADALSGRCLKYEPTLARLAPKGGWDVKRMSRYMYRESRCTPHVRSRTSDSGLLQINDVNLPYLSQKLGIRVTPWLLMNPAYNVWAAAELCMYARRAWGNCYQPWATH